MDGKLFIFTGANKIPVCRRRFERVKRNLKEAGVQYRTCRDRTGEKAHRPLFDLDRGVKEIFGSDSVLILKHFSSVQSSHFNDALSSSNVTYTVEQSTEKCVFWHYSLEMNTNVKRKFQMA